MKIEKFLERVDREVDFVFIANVSWNPCYIQRDVWIVNFSDFKLVF